MKKYSSPREFLRDVYTTPEVEKEVNALPPEKLARLNKALEPELAKLKEELQALMKNAWSVFNQAWTMGVYWAVYYSSRPKRFYAEKELVDFLLKKKEREAIDLKERLNNLQQMLTELDQDGKSTLRKCLIVMFNTYITESCLEGLQNHFASLPFPYYCYGTRYKGGCPWEDDPEQCVFRKPFNDELLCEYYYISTEEAKTRVKHFLASHSQAQAV